MVQSVGIQVYYSNGTVVLLCPVGPFFILPCAERLDWAALTDSGCVVLYISLPVICQEVLIMGSTGVCSLISRRPIAPTVP